MKNLALALTLSLVGFASFAEPSVGEKVILFCSQDLRSVDGPRTSFELMQQITENRASYTLTIIKQGNSFADSHYEKHVLRSFDCEIHHEAFESYPVKYLLQNATCSRGAQIYSIKPLAESGFSITIKNADGAHPENLGFRDGFDCRYTPY